MIKRRARMNPKLRTKLIQQVKKMPELYDVNNTNYKDNNERDKAWMQIALNLGENSEVIRHEWKIMRDSYRQALRRRVMDGSTKLWIFEKEMDFLRPNMSTIRDSNKEYTAPKNDMYFDTTMENASSTFETMENGDDEEGDDVTHAAESKHFPDISQKSSDEDNGLELFFASVCQSTKGLPKDLQRTVKKEVLNVLIKAEEAANKE